MLKTIQQSPSRWHIIHTSSSSQDYVVAHVNKALYGGMFYGYLTNETGVASIEGETYDEVFFKVERRLIETHKISAA